MFDQNTLNSVWNSATVPKPQASQQSAPNKSSGGIAGFLNAIVHPFIQTGADIVHGIDTGEVNLAHALGLAKNVQAQTAKQAAGPLGKSVNNDNAKQFLGNVAQVAATVLPIGKAAEGTGALAKIVAGAKTGAKVGALAGGGNAVANNENVLKGAGLGAVTGGATAGILGNLLAKGTPQATDSAITAARAANGIKNPVASATAASRRYGTDLLANKLNISGEDAAKFNGPQTVATLQREYGLTPRQAAQLHPVITGSEGKSTEALDTALENMGHVNFADFGSILKNELQDPDYLSANDLSTSQAKNLSNLVDKYHDSLNGTLTTINNGNGRAARIGLTGTNAKAAMDIAKKLESQGFKNQTASSEAKNAAGDLQLKMADFIKRRIYNAPGGENALNEAKNDAASQLEGIAQASGNNKLSTVAQNFRLAPDFQAYRNISAPFVNAKQLIDKTDMNNFANKGTNGAGRGMFATLARGASKAVSPAGGKILSNIGNKADAAPQTAVTPNGILARLSNTQAAPVIQRAATVGSTGIIQPKANTPENTSANGLTPADLLNTDNLTNTTASESNQSTSPIDQNTLVALIAADPANAATYLGLYNALKPTSTGPKPTAQNVANAQSGLSSLQQLANMISSNPDVVRNAATPGQGLPLIGGYITNAAGAGSYEAAANNVLDSLARIRTGAAMNKSEEKFYQSLLPKAGDNQQTIQQKLSQLEQVFTSVLGSTNS